MSKVSIVFLSCLLALSLSPGVPAQQSPATDKSRPISTERVCPVITVEELTGGAEPGLVLTFAVSIAGGKPIKPAFKWTVSGGTISEGQGTTEIKVDTAEVGAVPLTATVEVEGYELWCSRSASLTVALTACSLPPQVRLFDEYTDLSEEDEQARLDNLALQLRDEPNSQAVIFYGPPKNQEEIARERAERAKEYLMERHGIKTNRVTTAISSTEYGRPFQILTGRFYVVPPGATFEPTP